MAPRRLTRVTSIHVTQRLASQLFHRTRPSLSDVSRVFVSVKRTLMLESRASLNKLAIRGIRSFDDKSVSVIEFYSPVTVIVGHNGSGKTVRALS